MILVFNSFVLISKGLLFGNVAVSAVQTKPADADLDLTRSSFASCRHKRIAAEHRRKAIQVQAKGRKFQFLWVFPPWN